jgi:EpsI family protein
LFETLSIAAPSLNEELRLLTTFVASNLIRATGIPVFIDGDLIHIKAGTFQIAQGCSGRAFFIIAVELSLFFGIAFLQTWRNRLILLGLGAVLSMIGNWVRVIALIIIGEITQMESSLIGEHAVFGWLIFGLVLIPLFGAGLKLENLELRESRANHAVQLGGSYKDTHMVVMVATAVVMVSALWVSHRVNEIYEREQSADPIHFPLIAGWNREGPWTGDSRPQFHEPPADAAAWYQSAKAKIGVFLANYPVQRQGREAVYFANKPLGAEVGFSVLSDIKIETVSGNEYSFGQFQTIDSETRRVVWLGSVVANTAVSGPLHAKITQAFGAIRHRVDAQVLVISSRCETETCTRARSRMTEFARIASDPLFEAARESTR